jgi:hypothetical protein
MVGSCLLHPAQTNTEIRLAKTNQHYPEALGELASRLLRSSATSDRVVRPGMVGRVMTGRTALLNILERQRYE